MKLQLAEGTTRAHYEVPGIRIEDCDRLGGVDSAQSMDHTLVLKRSAVTSLPVLCGKTRDHDDWTVGSMGIFPSGLDWACFPVEPYKGTIFRVSDRAFVTAALEIVDYDNIDFRFEKVGHSGASEIAVAIRNLAVAGLSTQYPIMTETMTLALAAETIRKLSPKLSERMNRTKSGLSSQVKKRVLEFINANVGTLISLSDIASVAGLSPHHFSRSFKKSIGMSPSRYMINRRVDAAKSLLADGEPIAQVAYACAFTSQSHLTTLFKREVGVTPGEYQRMVR